MEAPIYTAPTFSASDLSMPQTSIVNPGGKPTDAEKKLNADNDKLFNDYQKLFSAYLGGRSAEDIKKLQQVVDEDNKNVTDDQNAVIKEFQEKQTANAPKSDDGDIGKKILNFFSPIVHLFS